MKTLGDNRNLRPLSLPACVALALAVALSGCGGNSAGLPPKDPDPARVLAHSSGLVPSADSIKAVLVAARGTAGASVPKQAFRLYPPIEGVASWEDERTLVFKPSVPLERGRAYRVDLDLGLLDGAAPGGSDYFSFAIRAASQKIEVETIPPRLGRDGSLEASGLMRIADPPALAGGIAATDAAVEKALSASMGRIEWRHESARIHRFTVSGIARGSRPGELALRWDGRALGGKPGSTKLRLPAAGVFELLGARAVDDAEAGVGDATGGSRSLELAFSEALDRSQDLRGLVSVEGAEELRYSLSGSTLSLYARAWPAMAKLRVEGGLRDSKGRSLAVPVAATVAFKWEKPRLRFLSKGNILPTSQGLVLPVETMNLSGVIVEALRVRNDNMLQFLQVNDLDSSKELKRVGEVVWRKKFELEWKDDWRNRWVRQGLDLGPLIDANKEGLLQVRLTFRRDQVRYVCPKDHDFKDLRFPEDRVIDRDEEEGSYWDYSEEWSGDDYYEYKDDPCHPAYYLPSYDHDISARRNVVVSDIGVVLRREADGSWRAAASDLRSAKPLAGALVTLYNFQRRALASATTGPGGLARMDQAAAPGGSPGTALGNGEAAFATVSFGAQTSWLKVDEGAALTVGHFDVGGEKAESGLKGFIYGERGVWRPGDPMNLVFILMDGNGKLPERYPIAFELEDPLGRVVRTNTYGESVGGFYAIATGTGADAPTGTWTARVKAGGRVFARSLKVETVMPNRLKLGLDWGGDPYIARDTAGMRLKASWLTGAEAGALKADVSAVFQAAGTSFAAFGEYLFDDPTRSISGERATLFDGRLEEDGSAEFDVDLSPGGLAPGKLRANILTRVFEPSGVFSSESLAVDFHPYARYIGIKLPKGDKARGMLLTDKEHRVEIALVDRQGALAKGGGRVEVALYKLDWRWWWEKGEESLAERAQELYSRPIGKEIVDIGADGRGSWTFSVKYPSWGRYMLRAVDLDAPETGSGKGGDEGEAEAGSHSAAAIFYVDWPGWAGRGRDSGGASAMLELTVGKPKYAPGEKASVSFPSNADGRALVAIERAGRILSEEWVKTAKDTTLYEFPVTAAMSPNVYVHVTFVQPHLQTANDLPIRLYGVVPVMVEDPATRLRPVIDAPASIQPGGEVAFSVREEGGRPMTFTVAVVDEGLLGITRFKTSDPWDEFYRKEASSLRSWDLYQYVAGAFSGKLETLLAVGGSDEAMGGGNRKPSRFPPVARFFGPFALKAGETRRETFTMGPYIGAVRFMVVAGSLPMGGEGVANAAFGKVEKEVPVRAELMTQLTAPRLLSPEEEISVPATVFAFMGKKRVAVELRAVGSLSLSGEGKAQLDFAKDGDLVALFKIKAAKAPGSGRLTLVAEADGRRAEQSVDLEVRSLGLSVSKVTALSLEAGKFWKGAIVLPGQSGTNALSIEVSRLRPVDLAERVDWLVRYPHGCAEQTTSAAFPQLYLPKAVALESGKAKEAAANVAAAIERMRGFQTVRGGFSLWPGEAREDEWLTAYVSHFLLSARREGFGLAGGLLDASLSNMARAARAWNSSEAWSQSTQAYRLYDLALAGKADISAMNRLRDFPKLPVAARFRLAAAYALAGMREAGGELVAGKSTEAESWEGMAENTYGSLARERAIVLDSLLALGDTDRALPVYNRLAEDLDSRRWMSTQDLGTSLAAALPYIVLAASASAGELEATVPAAGGGWTRSVRLDKPMARIDVLAPAGGEVSLGLANKGEAPVFVRVLARGVPAAGAEKASSNGLSLVLRYLGMDGLTVDPKSLPVGADFMVEASVRNRSGLPLKNLALSHLLPSGWEIANFRVGQELPKPEREDARPAKAKTSAAYDYQDIRDDRVLTYFSLGNQETKTFRVYVNKSYAGRFFLPAVAVEAMYDPSRQALVPGRWLADAPARKP